MITSATLHIRCVNPTEVNKHSKGTVLLPEAHDFLNTSLNNAIEDLAVCWTMNTAVIIKGQHRHENLFRKQVK